MSDDKQKTEEQQFSNKILKDVFQELHDTVVENINTFSVIGKMFSARVISTNDMQELYFINNPNMMCTRFLIILHKAKNPRTFIALREAITTEVSCEWLVEKIDKKYNLQASAAAQPQVNRVSSNPSQTPLNGDTGDVNDLNRVNDDLRKDNAILTTENSRLLEENANQKLDNEQVSTNNVILSTENNRLLEENNRLTDDNKRLCLERSTNDEKMANIVDKLKKELASVRKSQNNPQLLFTLDQPPTHSNDVPRQVNGVVMLDNFLYVVYEKFNKVQVFHCEYVGKKIKDIRVEEMKSLYGCFFDIVGSSVTSQLFISGDDSDVIWRVNLKSGLSEVFVKTGYYHTSLSLVENRLLVTSRDSLLMFDILSGERIKTIPLTGINSIWHAIESNKDSFFVCHGQSSHNSTVREIDSEGRVIRVFDNKQQFFCVHLALDSVGRLLAADFENCQVVLFDEDLKYERILIDNKRLVNSKPFSLHYNSNNRLTVGFDNGHVKIFEY